jgi:N-acetyl-anhydromuramyl-L-alanine amidase AmpD
MSINQAIYDGPGRNHRRDKFDKKYIVIHSTENDASAENEAAYAKRRTDGVSSHFYVDSNSIVQSLDTDWRAQHVGSTEGNNHGISVEVTGTKSKSRSWWFGNVAWTKLNAELRKACAEHNITPQLLTVAQIKQGELTGIITHDQARRAWGNTTHTDPGPNFPMDMLVSKDPGSSPKPTPKPTPPKGDDFMSALPNTKLGDSGWFVGVIQALLNLNGAGLKEDRVFGPKTEAKVKTHQRMFKLSADGEVGPKTWPTLVRNKR